MFVPRALFLTFIDVLHVILWTVVIVWYLDLQLPVQSVPITTKIVISNPVHGEVTVYSIYYVIKFVSDLRQVGGLLQVLRFPPPIPVKLTATIFLKYC